MSVPKKKLTRRKTRSRRAHHALKEINLAKCPKCKKPIRPHTACSFCGYYKGRMVIDVEKKLAKKRSKREQRKVEKEKGKEDNKKQAAEMQQAGVAPTKKDDKGKKVVV